MPKVYATDHHPRGERFAFWRDVICEAYLPIHCETHDTPRFEGRIELDRLSKLNISRVKGSPQCVSRHKMQIARNTDAYFMLSLQLTDQGHLSQRGRTTMLRPGDFGLYSTAEPYEISCKQPVNQLIVQIPEKALLERVPDAHELTGCGVAANTEIGGLVSSQLRENASRIAAQSSLVQSHMQDMMVDLVATGLSTLINHKVELSRPGHLLLTRAKEKIRDHLRDDELSPAFIAASLGMSQRNLARVFQRDGDTISNFIRQSRLDAIAADLIDPRFASHSISQLACKYGITNFQHFSTMFKSHFGMSPRAFRTTKRNLQ
ncbi:helix-turn-helix domain-containing protein [Marinovum sp. 2_MG-2023]|uniref:AraC-like ligand-binding domain-containing protein n=1 Tax=unclassified Marinovum TaxID=2647166 RepID=UPI0026E2B3B2|nr:MULTISPECIES: helix-turn-helix domain-containing protein [unclassified Marinovum]MDO6732368.1 helix-turn-helix domain-containing protein [Marinovum sp. 2_MG-2023]MDO6781685.1 helix-turn-helix domain-containing protein [Marinovum sp. 1_MG-2023]